MKVILNKDLNPLGEEGDVKDVAKGYARNYLFPRGIALPYTDKTVKLFEARKEEIETRKAEKRKNAAGIKERLEALELVIAMPAGANGKLYGAVTAQSIADELTKQGFPMERKRIEVPGNNFKSVGKYKVQVKLYESAAAEVGVTVEAQIIKFEAKGGASARRIRRRQELPGEQRANEAEAPPGEAAENAPETKPPEPSSEPVQGAAEMPVEQGETRQ